MPVVKWAQKVVARAKAGGMPIPEIEDRLAQTSTSTSSGGASKKEESKKC